VQVRHRPSPRLRAYSSKTASHAPGSLIGVKDKDDQSGTRPTPPGFAFVLEGIEIAAGMD
jgi:hypothetical protein